MGSQPKVSVASYVLTLATPPRRFVTALFASTAPSDDHVLYFFSAPRVSGAGRPARWTPDTKTCSARTLRGAGRPAEVDAPETEELEIL